MIWPWQDPLFRTTQTMILSRMIIMGLRDYRDKNIPSARLYLRILADERTEIDPHMLDQEFMQSEKHWRPGSAGEQAQTDCGS